MTPIAVNKMVKIKTQMVMDSMLIPPIKEFKSRPIRGTTITLIPRLNAAFSILSSFFEGKSAFTRLNPGITRTNREPIMFRTSMNGKASSAMKKTNVIVMIEIDKIAQNQIASEDRMYA